MIAGPTKNGSGGAVFGPALETRAMAMNIIGKPNQIAGNTHLLKNVILDEMRRMTRRPAYSAAVCREAPVPKRRSM